MAGKEFEREELLDFVARVKQETECAHLLVMGSLSLASAETKQIPSSLRTSVDLDVTINLDPDDPRYEKEFIQLNDAMRFDYGDETPFAEKEGFFLDAVPARVLVNGARGWQDRLVTVLHQGEEIAQALEANDLACFKLAAGSEFTPHRAKDGRFVAEAIEEGFVSCSKLQQMLPSMPHFHEKDVQKRIDQKLGEIVQILGDKESPLLAQAKTLIKHLENVRKLGS